MKRIRKPNPTSAAPDVAACYDTMLVGSLTAHRERPSAHVSSGYELQDYGLAVALATWPPATAKKSIRKKRRAMVAQLERMGRTVLSCLDYEGGHAALYAADPARAGIFARFVEAFCVVSALARDHN